MRAARPRRRSSLRIPVRVSIAPINGTSVGGKRSKPAPLRTCWVTFRLTVTSIVAPSGASRARRSASVAPMRSKRLKPSFSRSEVIMGEIGGSLS
eukprot:2614606-Rhodomonas_salina.1